MNTRFILFGLLATVLCLSTLSSCNQGNAASNTPTAPCCPETNEFEVDSDNDGLSNGTEKRLGTLPDVADTDGDGERDGDEVGPDTSNPLDFDRDGIIDALDSSARDTDGDGIRDEDDPYNNTNCCTGKTSSANNPSAPVTSSPRHREPSPSNNPPVNTSPSEYYGSKDDCDCSEVAAEFDQIVAKANYSGTTTAASILHSLYPHCGTYGWKNDTAVSWRCGKFVRRDNDDGKKESSAGGLQSSF